jgi:hypothetical protein
VFHGAAFVTFVMLAAGMVAGAPGKCGETVTSLLKGADL